MLVALRRHSPPELGWGAGACTLFQTEICYFPPIHTYFKIQYYFQCLLPFHCISQTPFLERWTIKKPPQLEAGCWARSVCFTLFMEDQEVVFKILQHVSYWQATGLPQSKTFWLVCKVDQQGFYIRFQDQPSSIKEFEGATKWKPSSWHLRIEELHRANLSQIFINPIHHDRTCDSSAVIV